MRLPRRKIAPGSRTARRAPGSSPDRPTSTRKATARRGTSARRGLRRRAAAARRALRRNGASGLVGLLSVTARLVSGFATRLDGVVGAAATVLAAAWRSVALPVWRLARRSGAGALRTAAREVTPVRGLVLVGAVAAISLGGSQLGDYRAVEVGAPQYSTAATTTPAPEIDRHSPRAAHGAWVLAIAVASALVIALAVTKNWRLARLLIFLGAAVIAISILIDARQGLRVGTAGVTYQGARAILLGDFWVQLLSGAALVVVGPMLALELRAERDARAGRPARRSRRARRRGSVAAGGSSEVEGAAT